MKIIRTIFLLLLACTRACVANNATDDWVRYVFSFNPSDVNCGNFSIGDFIDTGSIPLLDNLPICRDREDGESASSFFEYLVGLIASVLGYDYESVFGLSIVDGGLEISVQMMPPIFARLLGGLPFMGSIVPDERRSLNLPPNNQAFSAGGEEVQTYGLQLVGALNVDTTGAVPRKVCIIDTGYDLGHVDLPPDATGMDGGLQGPWEIDGNGHGTHVAGTVGAIGGNAQGVVGVAGNGVELYIVKQLGDDGSSWGSELLQGVQACVDNGANVVSMSLGGPSYLQYEDEAFQALYDQGVLFVAAAGNDGLSTYSFPASYSSVISVAAVDSSKNVADFSQFNDQVELSGPGVAVLSTVPGDSYEYLDGTSMACPHVSGVAALVWSLYPEKTNQQIRAALDYSAEDLGATGWDPDFGYGLVRADLAAAYLAGDPNSVPPEMTIPDSTGGQNGDCVDAPPGWVDVDGDGCDVYAEYDLCSLYGTWVPGLYDNFVAQQACCVCGGGSNGCSDVEGWVDSDGDSCDVYEQNGYCSLYGNFFENDGYTASTACCACRGITSTSIASTSKSGTSRAGTGTTAASDRYVDKSGNIVNIPNSASIAIGMRLVISVVVVALLAV